MIQNAPHELLVDNEQAAVRICNPSGRSPFLLIGDHAGNLVPRSLSELGLDTTILAQHVGWDIGVAELGRTLSVALDAIFISQSYSRLVIDCNRDPASSEAVPTISDGRAVPGNLGVTPSERDARFSDLFAPYQAAIADEIDRRVMEGQSPILVSLHSFTPKLQEVERPWQIGVLHDGHNDGFARRLLAALQRRTDFVVGDNEPYRMDSTDFTIPYHAFSRGLGYVELEVRQDLLADRAGIEFWAGLLAELMEQERIG
ncbi:N-formylglutamate amidohydrolase [Glacieibacterium sp.]|uniref:N-formylglutamate amidohydrolase n=1 Tax=Glacieibacterium sp. TaxID=2860237 RepID=UPI003B00516E